MSQLDKSEEFPSSTPKTRLGRLLGEARTRLEPPSNELEISNQASDDLEFLPPELLEPRPETTTRLPSHWTPQESLKLRQLNGERVELLLEETRETFPAQLEHARERAALLTDALLTDAWRRLIGPAWKMLHALMSELLEARSLFDGDAEHVFATAEGVAARAGVSKRTVQRWCAKDYAGREYLECWMAKRRLYMTRTDGLPCTAGTVFRLSVAPIALDDRTPCKRPTLEAMKAPWRLADELPEAVKVRALEDGFSFSPNERQEMTADKTFPKSTECFGLWTIKVQGRELSKSLFTLNSNERQFPNPLSTISKLSRSSVWHAEAYHRAVLVCDRLKDHASQVFWYTQFRKALVNGQSDAHIWAAVSQALEMSEKNAIRRTRGAYAVGILQRTSLIRA